nr:putative ribonuclease H-like domain-containing protein [Tanacetum cinerariifolium]
QTLRDYYEEVGISHETSVAFSPQQNGVVERRNRTLIEAACTMLIYAQAPLFLWAEAVATACFTQNRSIIRLRHGKTTYELLHSCYNENLALMLAADSDEVIRLEKESRSKLSDLIRPFDYDKLNNLYDLFVPQREKSSEQHEVTNLQCDYLELLEKCKCLEIELSKSKIMSKSFESVQKHAINLEIELQQCKEKIKNDKLFKVNQTKDFYKEREQDFEIQDLKAQLQDKGIVINELKKLIEKLKVASESNQKPRNFTRKLYERVNKTCSWWYSKFTSSGYKWKPKSGKENVNPNLIEIVLFIVDSGAQST